MDDSFQIRVIIATRWGGGDQWLRVENTPKRLQGLHRDQRAGRIAYEGAVTFIQHPKRQPEHAAVGQLDLACVRHKPIDSSPNPYVGVEIGMMPVADSNRRRKLSSVGMVSSAAMHRKWPGIRPGEGSAGR
jgi:hypothetical protein